MIRTKLALLVGVIYCAQMLLFVNPVAALAAEPTPDEYWLRDTNLKISAYQRVPTGSDVYYLEVFNDSDDALLSMSDWIITGVFASGAVIQRIPLNVHGLYPGELAPRKHAVIEIAAEVQGASYAAAWETQPSANAILANLEVSAVRSGYKTDSYQLKTTTDSVTKKTIYDDFWVRSQISGESYTSTLSSFTISSLQLLDDGLYETPASFPGSIVEIYPYSSDCAPNDLSSLCGDYIKLKLDDGLTDYTEYVLRTDSNSSSRTSSNTFYLADYALSDDGYLTIIQTQDGDKLSITNAGGYVWLEDLYGTRVYGSTMTSYEPAGTDEQGLSWARAEDGAWYWSTTPQPSAPNRITLPVEEVAACPVGKYRNPETGRCRTIEEAVNALAACAEGQYRNPATNRCKQLIATTAALKPCAEGQERNPATNRCRSIVSAVAELLPCNEGYERNPATNRCRKVTAVLAASAGSGDIGNENERGTGSIAGWGWALAAVAAGGAVGYGIYEWRHELVSGWNSFRARVGRK